MSRSFFSFELCVSVQARLLLLAVPNIAHVLVISGLTAVFELGTRMFAMWQHGRLWRRTHALPAFSAVDWERRCRLLACSIQGDMVVEYVGANLAALLQWSCQDR